MLAPEEALRPVLKCWSKALQGTTCWLFLSATVCKCNVGFGVRTYVCLCGEGSNSRSGLGYSWNV